MATVISQGNNAKQGKEGATSIPALANAASNFHLAHTK